VLLNTAVGQSINHHSSVSASFEPGDQPPGIANALTHVPADAVAQGLRTHAADPDFFFTHPDNASSVDDQSSASGAPFEPGDQPPGIANALTHVPADAVAQGLRTHAADPDFFFTHSRASEG
jgi:hypothetical protein